MINKVIRPETQKWLTNVVTVAYAVNNVNFEIACYANKIRSYLMGVEKNIMEVLQTDIIFSDALHGKTHSNKELLENFQTTDKISICELIIKKGKQQLTEQERTTELNRTIREIVAIITQRTVNPATGCTFPPQLLEEAIKQQLHYSPNNFPISEQAAAVIKQLQQIVELKILPVSIQLEIQNGKMQQFIEYCQANSITLDNFIVEENVAYFDTPTEKIATIREFLRGNQIWHLLNVQKTFKLTK